MVKENHKPVLIVIAGPNGRPFKRYTDDKPFKRYTDDIPLWAQTIIAWRFLQPGRPNPTHRIV